MALAKIKRNPKAFYAYARRFSKTYSGVGPFIKENGDKINETEAEALRMQYKKVFSTHKEDAKIENLKDVFSNTENENNINEIHFSY